MVCNLNVRALSKYGGVNNTGYSPCSLRAWRQRSARAWGQWSSSWTWTNTGYLKKSKNQYGQWTFGSLGLFVTYSFNPDLSDIWTLGHLDIWALGHFDSTDRLGDVTVNRDKGTPNPKLLVTRPEGSTQQFDWLQLPSKEYKPRQRNLWEMYHYYKFELFTSIHCKGTIR